MKVLSLSYCFPNARNRTWGVFVFQRLSALAGHVELDVAAPVPAFPLISRARGPLPAPVEQWGGLTVFHPRYLYFPGVLKSLDGWFYGRGLRKWLADYVDTERPELLDAHFVWPDGVGVRHLSRRVGLPYTITLRGWLYESMRTPRILRQCVEAMHGAAAVISVSSHLAQTAVELGIAEEKLHVIPNGVDTERFRPRDRDEARRELSLPTDGRLVVSVAHLGARKGSREAVGALRRLPDDVRLVLVGGDPAGGDNERALRGLARRLGLADRVLLVGRQPYERIPLYFAAADVSVLPSYREGCPNVVLEALASGRPVVATRVGAVPDLIAEPDHGRIVPPRDADALADALADVLGRTWSAQALAAAEPVKSWDRIADNVKVVFDRALGGRT